MIELRQGDILAADAEALVNTVNCVGIMGRGIALQFRKAFPENYKAYVAACKRQEVAPGRMLVSATRQLSNPQFIINFPTKRHWRGNSRIEDIKIGLDALVQDIKRLGIRSIAIPPLGCGLGGLAWEQVRPLIEAALARVPDVEAIVFVPSGAPSADSMVRSRDVPRMTAGRAALVELIRRYLAGLMDPFVTLLEIHKLMYFMQEAGEPLRLRYAKGIYGPYAENLRQLMIRVEGNFLTGYADGGDAPGKQIELVPGTVADAASFLQNHPGTNRRLSRVTGLVQGFETPFGLELLATTHWVAKSGEASPDDDEIIASIYSWNPRKRRFAPDQIHLALDVLRSHGWLPKPT
jgi:O-acetyl-ADP-ribose deacetylase (regulator of RNase III)